MERDSGTGSDGKGSGTTTLKSGALGTFSVAFLIVSAAAPLGYLAGYGPLALLIGGPGAAASFVLGGLALAAFLGAFTTMTPYVKSSGAFYAYVRAGLGRAVGTVAAVFAVVATTWRWSERWAPSRPTWCPTSTTSSAEPCRGRWWPSPPR
ncbi:hypothetical protein [Pimelobacter simplex]|uniref:hypothetical protein n=1 Tax=Nocardioides simplex TaxID=2045 RepID=UPI003AAE30FB